jgi:hypothetical protein
MVRNIYNVVTITKGGRATVKLCRKSKTQFVNQERDMQNAIALLNYLKRIAPQQLMLRTQVFTKTFLKSTEGKRRFPDYQALDLTTTLVRAKLSQLCLKSCD